MGQMVGLNAYLPEVYYRNGMYERGFRSLMAQMDPGLHRREYPEVSYTAVGHVLELNGVAREARRRGREGEGRGSIFEVVVPPGAEMVVGVPKTR